MGGFPVKQPLPTMHVEQIDPFLLLHHAVARVPADRDPMTAGVGPHPHRGFSPVTFVFKGGVHHRDSRGNSSVISAGGTQWMNAGMGVIHSERPPENIHELGGTQEIIQLWINTPQKNKMDQPEYYPVTAEDTPQVLSEDTNVDIRIVSGVYKGVEGPVPSLSPVMALRMTFTKGGSHYFEIPQNYNAFIYLLDGKLKVEGYGYVDGLNLVNLGNDAPGIGLEALADTRFILMAGEPLNEPMVSHGPFVMNTTTEVMEAMRDYQMGKMGVLIEE
jgi:redox-sensitive bicupin YhaK (pirin superfamily)